MRNLWAPWRMEYILSEKKPRECLFCAAPKHGNDREMLILYRGELNYIIMNRYPYNNGHLMVVPFKHVSGLEELTEAEQCEMLKLTAFSIEGLKAAFGPDGFNAGVNIGKVAGAGIEEHLHMHIVPRWAGDTSFMSVLDEIRVIPQHVLETYDSLYPHFNRP